MSLKMDDVYRSGHACVGTPSHAINEVMQIKPYFSTRTDDVTWVRRDVAIEAADHSERNFEDNAFSRCRYGDGHKRGYGPSGDDQMAERYIGES